MNVERKKRVFVVEYDLVSPIGIGKEKVLENLQANFLAAHTIERFPVEGLPIGYAAGVRGDLRHFYQHEPELVKEAAFFDRKFELALAVYFLMEERLKQILKNADPSRAGIVFGLGADAPPVERMQEFIPKNFVANETTIEQFLQSVNRSEGLLNRIANPYDISSLYIAEKLQLGAFQKTVLTACTASTQAIVVGYDSIVNGETDVVIAGGTDSIINMLAFISFNKLGVLSPTTDRPTSACKPFDNNRNGTLAGEASGICVLASEEFVLQNKLTPKFEVLGYGNTLDAYNITAPDPKGVGMKRAFAQALKSSNLLPEQVDYINLHGTGTRSNDPVEFDAVKSVFGEAAAHIPMSSTKDRTGHAIAAAGIQEFSILGICMENDFVPCNVNLEKPIGKGEIDLVKDTNRNKKINIGMTSNFAFGGVNTVIALKRV